jgi:hypothetical protein
LLFGQEAFFLVVSFCLSDIGNPKPFVNVKDFGYFFKNVTPFSPSSSISNNVVSFPKLGAGRVSRRNINPSPDIM